MKIVVAVTAASGALYARLCLEQLLRAEEVSEIALVYSTHASDCLLYTSDAADE